MTTLGKSDATDVIIIACMVMAGTTVIRRIKEKPHAKAEYVQPVVYGFFLCLALLVLAVPLPTFTKGLAYLGMVGAFAVNGPTIYKLAAGKK